MSSPSIMLPSSEKLVKVSFRLPESKLLLIDALVKERLYVDRSSFFRTATDSELNTQESFRISFEEHRKELEAALK